MRSRLIAIGAVALTAMTAHAQQNYDPGTMTFKRTGHNQWGAPGEHGLLDWIKMSDPIGGTFNVGPYSDLLSTGMAVSIHVDVAAGIQIKVWGKDGVINVEYPCGITLTYPDPRTLRPGDNFMISSSFARSGTGSMNSTAPNFGFSIAGLLNFDISVGGLVEIAGVDVYNETWWSENETLTVGLFNTDLPGFKEMVNLSGGDFSLLGGIIEGNYGFPEVTTTGGNGPGNSLTSSGSDEFLSAEISITDAILALVGLPINLNTSDSIGGDDWGASYELRVLDLRLEGGFSVLQDFNFEPRPIVQLNMSNGEIHKFEAGDSINLVFPDTEPGAATNNLTITPTYTLEGDVNNHSQLEIAVALVFEPFTLTGSASIAGVDGGINLSLGTFEILSDSVTVDMVDHDFVMKGFSTFEKTPFTIEGFTYPKATLGQIDPVCVPLNYGAFTLTLTGSDFVDDYTNGSGTTDGSRVHLEGNERTTTFVSSSELNADILASDTDTEGKKMITVFNPPPGGGNSNGIELIVDGSPPEITGAANPALLELTGNPKVLISVVISGNISDALCGVDVTTGTYSISDEYGVISGSGPVTIYPNGDYSFVVRLSPTRKAKDKDGRLYGITVKAKDMLGFEGTKVVNVVVPQ